MKYEFIEDESSRYTVKTFCLLLKVNRSSLYDWKHREVPSFNYDDWRIKNRLRALFKEVGKVLGVVKCEKTNKEGFFIGEYRVHRLRKELQLVVTQRQAYKVTTKRKHSDSVADNLLNQKFNPLRPNDFWAGDVTSLSDVASSLNDEQVGEYCQEQGVPPIRSTSGNLILSMVILKKKKQP